MGAVIVDHERVDQQRKSPECPPCQEGPARHLCILLPHGRRGVEKSQEQSLSLQVTMLPLYTLLLQDVRAFYSHSMVQTCIFEQQGCITLRKKTLKIHPPQQQYMMQTTAVVVFMNFLMS